MKKILTDKRGESLVETLAAVLIFTLASVGLYTMIVSSGEVNKRAKEADQHMQEQLIIAEKAVTPVGPPGLITMTIESAGSTATCDVNVYGDITKGELFSYFKKP